MPKPPVENNCDKMYHLRGLFGGSEMLSSIAKHIELLARPSIDLRSRWNLLWYDHQIASLKLVKENKAVMLWIDPPRAATTNGSQEDRC